MGEAKEIDVLQPIVTVEWHISGHEHVQGTVRAFYIK